MFNKTDKSFYYFPLETKGYNEIQSIFIPNSSHLSRETNVNKNTKYF